LTPRAPEERAQRDAELIARIVKAAFGQRRKTLANALSGIADSDAIAEAGIDPRARAEQLAPAAFVALSDVLKRRKPVAGRP
jgi:16S rRNA (adenine1518-N6/adenine1519-N6)-dimethyltransferase